MADAAGALRATMIVLGRVVVPLLPLAMLDERRLGAADLVPTLSGVSV